MATMAEVARPVGIVRECCDHGDYKHGDTVNGSSASCVPPQCTSPAIAFTCGPKLLVRDEVLRANPGCLGNPPGGSNSDTEHHVKKQQHTGSHIGVMPIF